LKTEEQIDAEVARLSHHKKEANDIRQEQLIKEE